MPISEKTSMLTILNFDTNATKLAGHGTSMMDGMLVLICENVTRIAEIRRTSRYNARYLRHLVFKRFRHAKRRDMRRVH